MLDSQPVYQRGPALPLSKPSSKYRQYRAQYAVIGDLNQLPQGPQIAKDVASSGIWLPDTALNRLVYTTSLEYMSNHAPLNVRPFFWYALPSDMIVDMMFGKLFFVVIMNLGRVVEALRGVGLHAEMPADESDYRRNFIPVSQVVSLEDHTSVKVILGGLEYYARKLSFEFLSLPSFAETAKAMLQTATDQASEIIHQDNVDTTGTATLSSNTDGGLRGN